MMDNPYGAPQAPVKDSADTPVKRPVLVWIIAIFALIGVISGAVGTLMLMSGHIPMVNEAERAYMQGLTPLDHLLTFIGLGLYALGALYLFRLKKVAVNILIVNALFKAGLGAYFYTKPTYRAFIASVSHSVGPFRHIGIYVGWLIVLAIIAYALKLRRDGVLR
ncbi:MAG TPA: hypothetical protein VKA50_08940 [Gammaproteobacteria bacterium]|nr:hypothetical protein [Gammaproteobacteria bacterium]